ncbi:MAG: M64 family metallopeptidase, partial [Bryobacteraceae bacterium]
MRKHFLILLGCCSLYAQTVTTIVNNGAPSNRVDIAIVGDGYTSDELGKFATDAQNLATTFFDQDPWKEYKNFFNVHRVDVASAQSGSDHPESSPQVFKNTAFDSAYNCSGVQRLICVSTSKVNTALSAVLTAAQRDIILVVVNDSVYGGSGGTVAVASTNVSSPEIALHEIGHSFGLLADEYGGPAPPACVNSVEPSAVNATIQTVRAQIKWGPWIAAETPLPTLSTTAALPGLYQGAAYCDTGVYRPTNSSKMRSLGVPFEQINVEQLTKRIYNLVNAIDAVSPTAAAVTVAQGQVAAFSATILLPLTHSLTSTWLVDSLTAGTGSTFSTSTLTPGNHVVTLKVSDPTLLVRTDTAQLLSDTRSWNVTVTGSCTYTLGQPSSAFPNAGGNGSVTVTTQSGCGWTAAVNSASWITITSGASGTGSGSVNLSVAGNGTAAARNGTLTIAGQTFTVTQAAGVPPCATAISSPSSSAPATGGTGSVGVSAPGACTWVALSSAPWLTISQPAGGAGSGAVTYTAAANNSASSRSATISISGFTFSLTQSGSQIFNTTFFVNQLYLDLLNRPSEAGGLAFWTNAINNASVTRKDAALGFFNSTEFQSSGLYIISSYIAVLGRDPDFGGWQFWFQSLQN